jgi:ABC-2 type transport system permease protein
VIGVELVKLARRPRTWVSIGLLCGLPAVVAVFLAVTDVGPDPGEEPAFLSAVLGNGALFPAAALIVLPVFLLVAVAVVGCDSIAGEASSGTLRYLLVRPVPRTRLLVAKLVGLVAFVLLAVLLVAVSAYLGGGEHVRVDPGALTSISGVTLTVTELVLRTAGTVGFITVSMLGVGAIALFLTSQVLVSLDAASAVGPYLPTRYWLAWIDLFRDPIVWREINRGLAIQAVYVGVFLALAWARFATKDVTA